MGSKATIYGSVLDFDLNVLGKEMIVFRWLTQVRLFDLLN